MRKAAPRQLSAIVLGTGIAFDAIAAILDHLVARSNIAVSPLAYGFLTGALFLSAFFGLIGTSAGSLMWARRASNAAVIAAIIGLVLATMIYTNRATFGFDDERVMVIPFVGLMMLLLIVGRLVGHTKANREMSPESKTAR
jgi:hypothetical protein